MSAFVVEHSTINKIVSYLKGDAQFPSQSLSHGSCARKIMKLGFDLTQVKECQRLAQKMLCLNVSAVEQRYNEKDEVVEPLIFKDFHLSDPAQVYKALRCWLYQCSEGDVPENNLYKMMDSIADLLADDIVSNLPEYNQALWG